MSAPKRFFIDKIDYPAVSSVYLEGEEFVHAKTVLRVVAGTEITFLDNSGNEYSAIVDKVEKTRLSAHITGVNKGDREAKNKIYLLVGALKGDKTEFAVQKATELGVYKIGVFKSEFCSAYINQNKLERLNKVAREAAKQCMRSVAPKVEYFDNFTAALASAQGYKNKLFFCEFATETDIDLLSLAGDTALVVGSEGGFSQNEFDLAKSEYGYKGVSLGKRILRAETAAVAACTVAAFCLKELE